MGAHGRFEQLADTFVIAIWPFYALSVAALYRLRRREPAIDRFRMLGYPVLPVVFIAGVVYLIVNATLEQPGWTGTVFAVIAAGIPVYRRFFRRVGNGLAA